MAELWASTGAIWRDVLLAEARVPMSVCQSAALHEKHSGNFCEILYSIMDCCYVKNPLNVGLVLLKMAAIFLIFCYNIFM